MKLKNILDLEEILTCVITYFACPLLNWGRGRVSIERKEGRNGVVNNAGCLGRFKDGGKRRWRTRSWGNVNQQRCTGSVRTERQVALAKKRGPAGVRRLLSRRGRFLRPFPMRGANITPGVTDSRCPFSSTVRATARHKTTPLPSVFEPSVSSVARIREPERPLFTLLNLPL